MTKQEPFGVIGLGGRKQVEPSVYGMAYEAIRTTPDEREGGNGHDARGAERKAAERLILAAERLTWHGRAALLQELEKSLLGVAGHRCTMKFGVNRYNNTACCVCGAAVEPRHGLVFWLISRRMGTSFLFALCDAHAKMRFEVDVNLTTGKCESDVGPQ